MRTRLLLGAWLLVAAACSGSAEPLTESTTEPPASSVIEEEPAVTSTSTSVAPPTTTLTPLTLPRFEPGDCVSTDLISLSRGSTHDLECGFVVVLENRAEPDGPTVSLPVAVARTRNADGRPDPVIYLAGGGGHAHLTYGHFFLESVGNAVLEKRDFVQYNQRGAPDTEPELSCPGYTEFLFTLAGRSEVDSMWTAEHAAYLDQCRHDLADAGIDLTQYNSATNAEDARDVRIALGYEEANYYGTSYGTRLGLAMIRDNPEGVRSIILDSVYPPEVGYYTEYASSLARSFDAVFTACAADATCGGDHPTLENDFYATARRLNETPGTVNSPFGPVSVDGGIFMDAMAIYLYSPEWIPRAPGAMAAVAGGDLQPVEDVVVGAITAPDLNWNMFYAMQCREEVPFESYEAAVSASEGLAEPVVAHYTEGFSRFHFEMCESSLSEVADPLEAEAVTSDIPALVMAGRFDPATPPYWSEGTAQALANAAFFEFPTLGHGVVRSNECALAIALAFIDDPNQPPDSTCIAELEPISFSVGDNE